MKGIKKDTKKASRVGVTNMGKYLLSDFCINTLLPGKVCLT
jgi:hypothetical protein